MRRPWLRVRAILAAALILFIHVRGWAGEIPCARHASAHGATHQHAHAGHGTHEGGKGDPCTCLDHCPACQGVALAARAPSIPESPILRAHGGGSVPPSAHLPTQSEYRLPLSTAPPV
jgi:hypothetical protein